MNYSNCAYFSAEWQILANVGIMLAFTAVREVLQLLHSCSAALNLNGCNINPRVSKSYLFRFVSSCAKYQTDLKYYSMRRYLFPSSVSKYLLFNIYSNECIAINNSRTRAPARSKLCQHCYRMLILPSPSWIVLPLLSGLIRGLLIFANLA